MVKRLIEADDEEAWAIKICDMMDNLTEVQLMQRDKLERFLFKKSPVYIEQWKKYFDWTVMYTHFLSIYNKQIEDFNKKS